MKKGIIITLPRHDDVTEYLTHFSIYIEKESIQKNINLKKLRDKEANLKEFEKVVKKLKYKMIIFNGHGTKDTICGYRDEILVKKDLNDNFLLNNLIYARSCHAASVLGKKWEKSKNGCFIGYNSPFMFYMDSTRISSPLRDDVARLFLEPSNTIPLSLIKGNSVIEAHENSKKQIVKNIKKVLRRGIGESFMIAEALWNNYAGQEVLGNFNIKL